MVAIALGSNLGDRRAHLDYGIRRIGQLLTDLTVSQYIDTEPVGVGDQRRFLNAAAVGSGEWTPRELLEALLLIEEEQGRVRPYPGAPRSLDLDLILFGDVMVSAPDLQVPHPRFRGRRFVLEPLSAIAPDMKDPVTGVTVRELLSRLTS